MSYRFVPYQRDDTEQNLLGKILNILGAVAAGDTGWLVRGNVSTSAKQATSAPSTATPGTTEADVLTLAAGERAYIQNLSTNPLFVRRATGASSSAFHYVLQAGTGADNGTGGVIQISDHVGVVSVAGTSPRYIAWKISA